MLQKDQVEIYIVFSKIYRRWRQMISMNNTFIRNKFNASMYEQFSFKIKHSHTFRYFLSVFVLQIAILRTNIILHRNDVTQTILTLVSLLHVNLILPSTDPDILDFLSKSVISEKKKAWLGTRYNYWSMNLVNKTFWTSHDHDDISSLMWADDYELIIFLVEF